jgi:hypothetical protein
MNVTDYYHDPSVQSRMAEYMGGKTFDEASCIYLSRCDRITGVNGRKSPSDLSYFLERGFDVGRSLWDKQQLIVHLDIEYVNFDFPGEVYLDYYRAFFLQQSVVINTEKILLECGIQPLHLLSGRGHHFVWSVAKSSTAYAKLVVLGSQIGRFKTRTRPQASFSFQRFDQLTSSAFTGLGLVIEYLSCRISDGSKDECELPVQLSAVKVGPQQRGREIVSIDISEYGDPLATRMIRMPFSVYLKPREKEWIMPKQLKDNPPLIFVIPLYEMDYIKALEVMRNIEGCLDLARRVSVRIPDESDSMENLIKQYQGSRHARFHEWFYAQEHEKKEDWPGTYDKTSLGIFPSCIKHILLNPNDLLLRPEGIRQITAAFLAVGWHPRHIAGLICSKYERDYGWGSTWDEYDPAGRADFYTRIFSGLIVTGRDDLIDFNCLCAKEKQLCFDEGGQCCLDRFQDSVVKRRDYERLARGPFNRLFL